MLITSWRNDFTSVVSNAQWSLNRRRLAYLRVSRLHCKLDYPVWTSICCRFARKGGLRREKSVRWVTVRLRYLSGVLHPRRANQGCPGGKSYLQSQHVGQHAAAEWLELVGVRGRVEQRHSYCVRAGSKQSAGASKQR